MAQFGPDIQTLDGQLGVRIATSDAIKGLITNGPSTAGFSLGEVKRFTRPEDAVAAGINAAYDSNNKVLVYETIKEFFRLQPEGVLYVLLVAQSVTQIQMVQTHWPALIKSNVIRTGERVSSVSLKRNVPTGFEAQIALGLWLEVPQARAAWAAVKNTLESEGYFPGVMIIDGSYAGPVADLPNLRAINDAPGVAICIGQDPAVAARDALFNKYADTGAMLGLIANRKAAESMAALQVENPPRKFRGQSVLNMTDTLQARWLRGALSNQVECSALTAVQINQINSYGYNYFDRVNNFAGVYGVNGATCAELTSDFSYIERWEILQKAKHLAYQFFAPLRNRVVDIVDSKINPNYNAYLENEATSAVLGQLRFERNISEYQGVDGAGVFLPQDYNFITGEHESDPAQNLAPETLKVQIGVPIRGIIRNVTIFIGLKA
jgi:hypothetical protein